MVTCGSPDVMEEFKREFYSLVNDAFHFQVISKSLWEFISVELMKIRKLFTVSLRPRKQMGNIKGRPIVSGIGNLTQNASRLIDSVLHPHVQTLLSYIKDTTSFLKQ